MILTTTDQLKKYVSVSKNFAFESFEPYIEKAAQTFTKKYIGNLHKTITELIDEQASGEEQDTYAEALELLRAAIANLGMFLYMPYATVLLDASGISNIQTDQRAPVQWWQLKDMRRDLLRAGNQALDDLLELLDSNLDLFEDYEQNFCSVNNSLIVNSASVFNNYYNINDSRQTYLALKPTLELVEDQYIKTMLCAELVTQLKTQPEKLELSENAKAALAALKIHLQKAIVSFTVSKVASLGLFELSATGLRINYENYIDGKTEPINSGKPSEQLNNLTNELLTNATNYLKIAETFIKDNPTEFTVCEEPLLNADQTGVGFKAYDSKGVFGL